MQALPRRRVLARSLAVALLLVLAPLAGIAQTSADTPEPSTEASPSSAAAADAQDVSTIAPPPAREDDAQNAEAGSAAPPEQFERTEAPRLELRPPAEASTPKPAAPEETPAAASPPDAGEGTPGDPAPQQTPSPKARNVQDQPEYWKRLSKGLDELGVGSSDKEKSAPQAGAPVEGGEGAPGARAATRGEPRTQLAPSPLNYLQWLAALCLVLALIPGSVYLLRRYGRKTRLLPATELATVLGRIHLSPRSALHFVKIGERVVVIGETAGSLAAITEYPAAPAPSGTLPEPPVAKPEAPAPLPEASEAAPAQPSPPAPPAPAPPASAEAVAKEGFLAHLRENVRAIKQLSSSPEDEETQEEVEDDELASLRDDIQRLQRSLRETSSDQNKE